MELKTTSFRLITSAVKKRDCNDVDIEAMSGNRCYPLRVPVKHCPFTNFVLLGQKADSCL